MAVVGVVYYTDPACPWSWALEPAFRRLLVALQGSLEVSYVMCGMASEFGEPATLVEESLQASASTGMRVDPRLDRRHQAVRAL